MLAGDSHFPFALNASVSPNCDLERTYRSLNLFEILNMPPVGKRKASCK